MTFASKSPDPHRRKNAQRRRVQNQQHQRDRAAAKNKSGAKDKKKNKPGTPAPGEQASVRRKRNSRGRAGQFTDKAATTKYTKKSSDGNTTNVLAPDGNYHPFKSNSLTFTFSDGKEHNEQIKKEGVWSVTNADGNWMWNNITGQYVKNTSDKGGGQNSFPGLGKMGTTYAGEHNPKNSTIKTLTDYSQPPQNIADYYGQVHDQDYDQLGLAGPEGTESPLSTPSNKKLIKNMNTVIQMYKSEETDPYTGVAVSEQTYQTAIAMKLAFQYVEGKKAAGQKIEQAKEKVKSWF